jgi:hypothetical protein
MTVMLASAVAQPAQRSDVRPKSQLRRFTRIGNSTRTGRVSVTSVNPPKLSIHSTCFAPSARIVRISRRDLKVYRSFPVVGSAAGLTRFDAQRIFYTLPKNNVDLAAVRRVRRQFQLQRADGFFCHPCPCASSWIAHRCWRFHLNSRFDRAHHASRSDEKLSRART